MRVAAAEQMLRGSRPRRRASDAAATPLASAAQPGPTDKRGSVEFKKDMAGVLVARALAKTLERLGVGGLA